MNMLSQEENDSLKNYRVCVIGCGGLGGYIIEMLGRLGIGYITVVDGDSFDETNLNRQILSNMSSLGKPKAMEAKDRMKLVNPLVSINPIMEKLTSENGESILINHDVIVDAVDSIETRLLIQEIAEKLNIPLVHGAIAGWYGQVTTILPGDNTLNKLYINKKMRGIENDLGNPSFTPALIASIEVSEVLKLLIRRGEILRKKLLYMDLLDQDCFIMDL